MKKTNLNLGNFWFRVDFGFWGTFYFFKIMNKFITVSKIFIGVFGINNELKNWF